MQPAAAFGEVLDDLVGRFQPEAPAAGPRWHPGIATRPLLSFDGNPPRPRLARVSRRPARTLSARERAALDLLVGLGASLTPGFTRQELRSAFRALARRYHPDAHPATSAAEKARLSSRFATLRDAYDALQRSASA